MTIGEKIKTLRQKKGLTQKQLGDLCGMADSAIRRYESGRANPKIETLEKIARALDIYVHELYGSDPLAESKQLSSFLSYLDTLGYEFIDGSFYDAPSNEIGLIHIKSENLDIPLSQKDFDVLENSIENNINLEIYRLCKEKRI